MNNQPLHCPVCRLKLYKRKDGSVCKNHRCPLFHKCGAGWILSPLGIWFYQDKRAFRDLKYGVKPYVDWGKILLGAHALSLSKMNVGEVVLR